MDFPALDFDPLAIPLGALLLAKGLVLVVLSCLAWLVVFE